MGCSSFMCNVCGEAVLSDSQSGDLVRLFFLERGEVKEKMQGQYDSYCRVFTEDLKGCIEWTHKPWPEMVDDHYGPDKSTGLAAIHEKCWRGEASRERSEDDPNQGWGEDGEYDGETW